MSAGWLAADKLTQLFVAVFISAWIDFEPMLCLADTNRIKGLGWRPKYSLAEGLASTLNKLKS